MTEKAEGHASWGHEAKAAPKPREPKAGEVGVVTGDLLHVKKTDADPEKAPLKTVVVQGGVTYRYEGWSVADEAWQYRAEAKPA